MFWQSSASTEKASDPYVHANIVPLSTRISDTLRELNVNDYQVVCAGQLVAELDDTDYQAELHEAESNLDAAHTAFDDNQAQKQVQRASIAAAQQQADEAMRTEQATGGNVVSAQAEAIEVDEERRRQEALYAENVTTRRTLEKAVAESRRAHGALDSAEGDRKKAAAAVNAARENEVGNERSASLKP